MLKLYNNLFLIIESIFNCVLSLLYVFNFNKNKLQKDEFDNIVIVVNGPSFSKDYKSNIFREKLKNYKLMVLNNFASSKLFEILKPSYYVILDNDVFCENQTVRVENLKKQILKNLLNKTSWKLQLFVPVRFKEV